MEKQDILLTPMNKLGLGTRFNSHFFYSKRNLMNQEEVITLDEFLKLNNQPLVGKEGFIVWKSEDARKKIWNSDNFTVVSDAFSKLKSFLLENNFDYNDWIMLLPITEDPQYRFRFKYELLSKEKLSKIWIHRISGIKANSIPYRNLWWIVNPNGDNRNICKPPITVEQVLGLDTGMLFHDGGPTWHSHQLKSIPKIQKKLREYGFSEKDGVFMTLEF